MNYHPDDHTAVEKLHSEFINRFDRVNDDLMTFQDAAYAMGLKRGQGELQAALARAAALQQRLNEADQRIDDAKHLLREFVVWYQATEDDSRGLLKLIRRADAICQLTKDSPEVGS